ncbi:S8 family serine peptidase [Luteolibacter algae]|uniref:S8 family serine peptidase n=1 Tax=Luteolibacter algae TaxID=454151 RepID=A0ABW5D5P1_9BACT
MTERLRRYLPAILILACGVFAFFLSYRQKELAPGEPERVERIARKKPQLSSVAKDTDTNIVETLSALPSGLEIEAFSSYHPNELILRFPTQESYATTINLVRRSPVRLLRQIDALRAVRLGYNEWQDMAVLLNSANISKLKPINSHPSVGRPIPGIGDKALAFKNSVNSWLGVTSDISQMGKGVKIAVIDTGVVPHAEIPSLYRSIEIEPFPGDLTMTHPHGTSVASLITGKGPGVIGLAPAARLISIRAIDESGSTDGFNIAAAILMAVDEGAQIINLSLGSASQTSLEKDAVEIALARGVVIVAGSGNDGQDRLLYPAAYPGVISVGALDAGGERMVFSNAGENLTITAPGYGIFAAAPGEKYLHFSGTSASAPIVTGALAAIMSDSSGRAVSAGEAVKVLLENADDIGLPGQDPEYGYGILNMNRVFTRTIPGILDAAITDVRLLNGGGGRIPTEIGVTVQNRGTATIINAELTVATAGGVSKKYVTLGTREIETFTSPLDANSGNAGPFQVDSSIILPASDHDITPDNNISRNIFSLPR